MTALVPLLALLALPAARVDDRIISLADVDATTGGRASALQAKLGAVFEAETWRHVDRHLGLKAPAPRPATDSEWAARRAEAPPSWDAALRDRAVRWQIEREHLREDRERAQAAGRRAAGVEVSPPDPARLGSRLPADQEVARVGDVRVTAGDVERSAALALYRLRGELFRERARRLEKLVERELLEAEAARRGQAVETLIPREEVTLDDAERYVAAQDAAGRPGLDAARVRPLLEARAANDARERLLTALRRRAVVEVFLEPPDVPRFDARDPDAPALGPADAPAENTIVVFADHRREPSRRVHEALRRVRESRPDLRVELRAFVPGFDPSAEESAGLLECAPGPKARLQLHEELLARTPPMFGEPWFDEEERAALAARIGADVDAFARCLDAEETAARIVDDTRAAEALGFTGPPAAVVAGVALTGVQSADTFAQTLDRASH